jgi:tRNA (mo5U34)-methyltransferase
MHLGMGVVTPGLKSPEQHMRELDSLRMPALAGKTVLDIGAWDGFYSFAAERLGAAHVVALDHHVWCLDRKAKNEYKADCKRKGIIQQHPKYIPELWRVNELPGNRGFDLARTTLESSVEAMVCDLMEAPVDLIGKFDVVLYLGVLYHMENPLESLRRVAQLTREVAIIETEAIEIGGHEARPLCEYFPPSAKLMDDPTNFWAPNAAALIGLCETAGFKRVEILTKAPRVRKGRLRRYRLVAHAFMTG